MPRKMRVRESVYRTTDYPTSISSRQQVLRTCLRCQTITLVMQDSESSTNVRLESLVLRTTQGCQTILISQHNGQKPSVKLFHSFSQSGQKIYRTAKRPTYLSSNSQYYGQCRAVRLSQLVGIMDRTICQLKPSTLPILMDSDTARLTQSAYQTSKTDKDHLSDKPPSRPPTLSSFGWRAGFGFRSFETPIKSNQYFILRILPLLSSSFPIIPGTDYLADYITHVCFKQ